MQPTADGTFGIVASLVPALEDDYTKAPLAAQDQVVLDYVVQVTRDATRIGPAEHERLHAVGFDDRAILQITLIAAWFNYINRGRRPRRRARRLIGTLSTFFG